ncbi:MAG: hypothetical protein PHS24_05210, partial [Bacilli bacterium]|nr:hypothetical protein [Bacilli bacterium]
MAQITYDNIIVKRRAGTQEDPYIHYENQLYKIINNKILLNEIPNRFNKVNITSEGITWVEIFDDKELEINEFKTDYINGIISFHPDRNGITVYIDFWGTGVIYFPSSRIWTQSELGNVTETLKNIIDNGQQAITALDEVNEFIVMESYDNSKTYKPLNKVSYLGSTYQCILETMGNIPTNTTYWILCASKGDKGEQGIQGIQGEQGVKGDKGD